MIEHVGVAMSARKQNRDMSDLPGLFFTTMNSRPCSTQAPPSDEWEKHVKGMERATEEMARAEAEREERNAAEYAKLVTPDPLNTPLGDGELEVYRKALKVFKRFQGYYESNKNTSLYPMEYRHIQYLVKYLPMMNENEKRVMQNRMSQIELILQGKDRPPRIEEENTEFLEVVDNFITRFQDIVDTQNTSEMFRESRRISRAS